MVGSVSGIEDCNGTGLLLAKKSQGGQAAFDLVNLRISKGGLLPVFLVVSCYVHYPERSALLSWPVRTGEVGNLPLDRRSAGG